MTIRQNIFRQIFEKSVSVKISPIKISRYTVHGIIGDLKYSAICSKMQLARFLIGGIEYCMERNPCLQPEWLGEVYMICQIKAIIKYTTYTLCN